MPLSTPTLALVLGLLLGAGSPGAQTPAGATGDSGWTRLEDPPAAPPRLELAEFGGRTRLVAEGDRLVRVDRRGRRAEVRCTDPEGPGQLRQLSADPAGLTWVAAERGLFLTGIDVDRLDRVALGPGAPEGTPTSVLVDGQRRVWLATEEAFGVVEPSFYWGRTFAPGDGVPGPGPYRLLGLRQGQVLLETGLGSFGYQLADERPECSGLRVQGLDVERGATLELDHGERPELEPAGSALGGATYRYRLDDHHVWRELAPGDRLGVLRPGRFRLQVVAVDRELNRSQPFELFLRVGYPFWAETRFAAIVLATSAALVLALCLLRARRRGGGGRRYALATFSAGLFLVLALQLLAGVVPHARGWPFIGFAMYTQTYEQNDVIYEAGMLALKQNGERKQVYEWDLGVTTDGRWQVLRPLIDGGASAGREAVAKLNQRWPQAPHFDGILVRARRIRLTADGPVEVAPMVLSYYREEPPLAR